MTSRWFFWSRAPSTFEQILHSDADAVDHVGVGGADSAAGRADLALAEEALGDLVDRAVVLRDDVRVAAHEQLRHIHAARAECGELVEEHLDVDDDAVGDDGDDALGEDAAGQQVQGVFFIADDDRVPGVVAAVELDDVVDAAGEEVGRLAFSLVAPLGSDDDDGRHGGPFRIESG